MTFDGELCGQCRHNVTFHPSVGTDSDKKRFGCLDCSCELNVLEALTWDLNGRELAALRSVAEKARAFMAGVTSFTRYGKSGKLVLWGNLGSWDEFSDALDRAARSDSSGGGKDGSGTP